jgi:hypothetical protein
MSYRWDKDWKLSSRDPTMEHAQAAMNRLLSVGNKKGKIIKEGRGFSVYIKTRKFSPNRQQPRI